MVGAILLSPPVAMCVFVILAYGLYRLGGALASRGEESPGKRQPYACGEDVLPSGAQPDYRAFFQLALMFGLLHLSTLMVSTLPPGMAAHRTALAYLLGVAACVLVLSRGQI